MKKIFIAALALVTFACNNSTSEELSTDVVKNPHTANGEVSMDMPKIKFKEERIEFGKITQGEKRSFTFEFTNTGEADLMITNVSAGCGCTVPKTWPKEPVKPGDTGKIEVTFDSEGKSGQQVKQIMVQANTNPSVTTVAISGDVITPTNTEIGKK